MQHQNALRESILKRMAKKVNPALLRELNEKFEGVKQKWAQGAVESALMDLSSMKEQVDTLTEIDEEMLRNEFSFDIEKIQRQLKILNKLRTLEAERALFHKHINFPSSFLQTQFSTISKNLATLKKNLNDMAEELKSPEFCKHIRLGDLQEEMRAQAQYLIDTAMSKAEKDGISDSKLWLEQALVLASDVGLSEEELSSLSIMLGHK